MRRIYLLFVILLTSSLACSLINTTTPLSTATVRPSLAASTQLPSATATVAPTGTKVPPGTQTLSATQTPVAKATNTTSPEEPTNTPYPTSVLDPSMRDEINLIQTQVVQERGLQSKYQVPVVLLTSAELRTNVISDYNKDYTDEEINDQIYELSIVGLLEPSFDLRNFNINLDSEEIAGYYDNDVKEMFVISDEGFTGPEHFIYSHEFTHVLQDQNYDISKGLKYNDENCEADSEYCGAVQALIEGDATLSQYTWLYNYATTQDQAQVVQYYNNLKLPIYDTAPVYIKDEFAFPYSQGLTFVQYFHDRGGWSAVDALYKNPPVSTEQILHPDLYPSDKPIPVDLPDVVSALGVAWREVSHNQMGEWDTYLILKDGVVEASRLDDATAQAAAAGWGGDEYQVLHNDSSNLTAFVMKTVWDTANDASQFSMALQKSLNSRFGVSAAQQGNTFTWTYTGGFSLFQISGNSTIWIISPDAATGQTISGVVKP